MPVISRLAALLKYLRHRGQAERDLEDEIRGTFERLVAEKVQAGLTSDEARRIAAIELGGVEQVKEQVRYAKTGALVDSVFQDLRYAGRSLRKNPGYAAVAILTLALAIGANTAMFIVVNAVILRPLPYRSPEQLVMVWTGMPGQTVPGRSAFGTVEEWRRRSKTFADIAVLDPISVTLTDNEGAERIGVARISPNFLPLIGAQPVRGRSFSNREAEERRRLILISDRFWQTRLGGSDDAIGTSIELDGLPSEIIGILPANFDLPGLNADVWEPSTMFPDWEARRGLRGPGSWFVFGRLRPTVTVDQAQTEMDAIARALDEELPASERNLGVTVIPLSVYVVGPRSRLALWMLTGAVLSVLLIAAANIASLTLARSAGRTREMAVRAALGAASGRIVRQLLAESVTLVAISGLVGTLLAAAGIRLIRAVGPLDLARLNEASLDLRVLAATVTVGLLIGILIGLAPASTVLRKNLFSGEESGRTVSGGLAIRRIRRALVVAQFALAIMLLAGAGLLVRSWLSIERVDPGFRPERILSMQLSTTAVEASAQRANFYDRVLEQIDSLPGVESAGLIGDLLISGGSEQVVTTEGGAGTTSQRLLLRRDEVSERLFATLGTPLLGGRFFSIEDGPDAPRVAIVNQTMARQVWPGSDPVGRRFKLGPTDSAPSWFTVVGVVGDMRRQGLDTEPVPQMFEPLAQNPSGLETLLVRTSSDEPSKMVTMIRTAVGRVDKRAPLYGVTTLKNRLSADLWQRRFQTSLLIGFAGVALLMAAIGLYGLIHYAVATRTKEIGIRMAVGAQAGDIFRMIVREALQLSATGLMLGLVGALLMGRAGSSFLFGVTAADPLTLTTVSLLLSAVALAAGYFPARRAMKVDPTVALRCE